MLVGKPKEKKQLGDQGFDGKAVKWIFKE